MAYEIVQNPNRNGSLREITEAKDGEESRRAGFFNGYVAQVAEFRDGRDIWHRAGFGSHERCTAVLDGLAAGRKRLKESLLVYDPAP